MTDDLNPPADLADLRDFSARIGADPLLIQAAGGNTSVKEGGVMWIKASGTLLADALAREIFVPVNLPAMQAALDDPETDADQPARFTLGAQTLRPSIETSLHAVLPQRVVIHVHCVNTLSLAIRSDARDVLSPLLADFDWCLVPYIKPGANLAGQVRARLAKATDVVVLQNHGLIVAADTVAGAEALLGRVVDALRQPPAAPAQADTEFLDRLTGPNWAVPPADSPVHQMALTPTRAGQATGGSLYPDHVIFCGVGVTAAEGALPPAAEGPVLLLVPGKGVVMRKDASAGAWALARCLSDVLMRVPEDAPLTYLTEAQNAELLDWDAEKYRQSLNA